MIEISNDVSSINNVSKLGYVNSNFKVKDMDLKLIPKYEQYMEYIYSVVLKLPRTEKFNIGMDIKSIMHRCLENIIYLSFCEKSSNRKLSYCSLIDSEFKIQRIYIRVMYKQKYINEKKYMYCISMLDELGRMLGGYIKYAKNN